MRLLYVIVLALMVLVSACAQQPPPVQQPIGAEVPPLPEEPEVVDVEGAAEEEVEEKVAGSEDVRIIGVGAFDPAELTINVGDSVTWFNDKEKEVVIIIFKGKVAYMNSNKIKPGEQFEHEFTEAGEYQYWQNIAYGSDGATITVE